MDAFKHINPKFLVWYRIIRVHNLSKTLQLDYRGNHFHIGEPTVALVVIIYGIIAQYGLSGLTVATFLAGLMLVGMGLLHFSDLFKYIPKTITVGFTLGIDVGIIAGQIKDLFCLNKVKMS